VTKGLITTESLAADVTHDLFIGAHFFVDVEIIQTPLAKQQPLSFELDIGH
jgi:hypothetical protein